MCVAVPEPSKQHIAPPEHQRLIDLKRARRQADDAAVFGQGVDRGLQAGIVGRLNLDSGPRQFHRGNIARLAARNGMHRPRGNQPQKSQTQANDFMVFLPRVKM